MLKFGAGHITLKFLDIYHNLEFANVAVSPDGLVFERVFTPKIMLAVRLYIILR